MRRLRVEPLEGRLLLATFSVNNLNDAVDATPLGDGRVDVDLATAGDQITLRAAIQETNALAGPDSIDVPAGTYTLSIPGAGENAAVTGDLDITDNLTISGAGPLNTFIDGARLDRVFHIHKKVTMHISGMTVRNGEVVGPAAGVYNDNGWGTITDCTVYGNSATGDGGGIYSHGPRTLTVTSSTISGNSAGGRGGGIYNTGSMHGLTVTNSTLSENSADMGGGIGTNQEDVIIKNTIIAGNTATTGAPDVLGAVASQGHNLVGSDAGSSGWVASDLLNEDPLLGPLQDNGGPTLTHALLLGSPAIDAGDNTAALPTDQRGFARIIDGNLDGTSTIDIGAFELCMPIVARDDEYVVQQDNLLVVPVATGVLSNDERPETTPLTAVWVSGTSHGTLALEPDGSFQYAPEAGFVGVDTFTYRAIAGGFYSDPATATITVEPGPPPEPVPVYFALEARATFGTMNVQVEDVVVFDGNRFRRFFDGSDVGVRRLPIDALAVVSENEILISFATAAAVPGIAGTVQPSDLVKFTATQLGPTTAGEFELYFDGSDVGLNTAAENVDGVELTEDGRLVFSTTGNLDAPNVDRAGEDLLLFTPTSLGPNTAGTWEPYFDGSDVGLAGASVDAVALDDADLLLSTGDTFSAAGLNADDEDVFTFLPTSLGPRTSGVYSPGLYFDGSQHGLEANDLVAVDLAPNRRPMAAEEDYQAPVNGVLNAAVDEGVLINDSDPDGDSLTAMLVDTPAHGTIVLGFNGSFCYVPNTGFSGIDRFTYVANDGRRNSGPAAVTIEAGMDLGTVGFLALDGLDPSHSDLWAWLDTAHNGYLTLDATFDPTDGDVQLTLYDESFTELTTSTGVGRSHRIDYLAGPGETYYVKLSGTSGDVDLRLANLVSHVGTELTVHGTDRADWFEFDPAASCVISINGIKYRFEDGEVNRTVFNGGEGDDVALLHGDPDGPNRFEAWPVRAKLSGDDYTVWAISARYVHAYAYQGMGDVALLHGDPNGPNRFESWPDQAKLRGDDYFVRAKAFRWVHAYAGQGPADVALLHGDPDGPNRLEAWPNQAKLYGDDYFARAKSFRYVHTYAYRSGDDEAVLHDSASTDYLTAEDNWAKLHDAAVAFFYRASGFDSVKAYSTTSSGDIKRVAAIDYLLDLSEYYWEDP